MTRIIPEFPKEVPSVLDFHPGTTGKEYSIQVITPIFGGGVKPGENGLDVIIRPSSIRGHLRFWWRATRGAKFETVTQLFNREGEIWGTPDSPSPVSIKISQPSSDSIGQRKASNHYGFQSKYGPESYVLFPARENEAPICKEGFSFQLKVNWLNQEKLQYLRDQENAELRREKKTPKAEKTPKVEKIDDIGPDIKAAIWAWTNFGGIGSRTRRGCGALFCKETAPPDAASIGKWYRDHLNEGCFGQTQQRKWPTIPNKILIGSTEGKPVAEWAAAIDIMRSFRQGVGVGRNPGNSSNARMPGRSLWPEPETIRKLIGSRLPKHKLQPCMIQPYLPADSFPRAELGLPIVFHFKDGQDPPPETLNKNREPFPTELCPVNAKRMASPIILRPLAFNDGAKAVRLIVQLNTELLNDVELKVGGNVISTIGPNGIRSPNLAKYPGSPMAGRTTEGSALEAFIAYATANKFKEVGL